MSCDSFLFLPRTPRRAYLQKPATALEEIGEGVVHGARDATTGPQRYTVSIAACRAAAHVVHWVVRENPRHCAENTKQVLVGHSVAKNPLLDRLGQAARHGHELAVFAFRQRPARAHSHLRSHVSTSLVPSVRRGQPIGGSRAQHLLTRRSRPARGGHGPHSGSCGAESATLLQVIGARLRCPVCGPSRNLYPTGSGARRLERD